MPTFFSMTLEARTRKSTTRTLAHGRALAVQLYSYGTPPRCVAAGTTLRSKSDPEYCGPTGLYSTLERTVAARGTPQSTTRTAELGPRVRIFRTPWTSPMVPPRWNLTERF